MHIALTWHSRGRSRRSLWVWDQPGLQSEFEDSRGYRDSYPFSPPLAYALGVDLHGSMSEGSSPLASSPASRMCQKIRERMERMWDLNPSSSPCRHQFSHNYISLPKAMASGRTSHPVLQLLLGSRNCSFSCIFLYPGLWSPSVIPFSLPTPFWMALSLPPSTNTSFRGFWGWNPGLPAC